MLALVGAEAPFDQGRRQIELLAGLNVTAKAVERTAEAVGADIGAGDGNWSAHHDWQAQFQGAVISRC